MNPTQISQRLANLTQQFQQMLSSAKRIEELPQQQNLVASSRVHVSNGGNSESLEIQKIIEAANSQAFNRLIFVGDFSLNGNVLTVPELTEWLIDNHTIQHLEAVDFNIPYSAADKIRRDVIFGNEQGDILREIGLEILDEDIEPPKPNIPPNTVEITSFLVTDSEIGVPDVPIVNGDYIAKYSRRDAYNGQTGENVLLPSPTSVNGTRLIGAGLVSIDGFIDSSGFAEPVLGDLFPITNDTGGPVILNDSPNFITDDLVLLNGKVAVVRYEGSGIYRLIASSAGNEKFILSNENLNKAKRKGNILYGILDRYTGEQISLFKIDAVPAGNSVDNIIYFQLGSEFFARAFTVYNIQWFGAKPDGSDCTQAIQNCIDSCFYAGGGTILTPHGIYTLSGPLVTSDNKGNNPNSQLYIPGKQDVAAGGTDKTISIKFIGSETPTMNASGFVDDKIAEIDQGCFWKSTLPLSETSGILPSVISTKGGNPTYNFNIIDVMFEDMWIRTHHDPTVGTYMSAFNMLDAAFSTFERCRADIDVAGFNTIQHQNLCIGIAPTKSNGGTTVIANNCTSYGYKIGYTVGEHAYYTNVNANFCVYAYDVSKAGHASMIVKGLTQWNKHALSFNMYDNGYGDEDPNYRPANFINIAEFIVETIGNSGAASSKWYKSTVDVVDPTNGIQGNCFFTKTISATGIFPNTKLIKNGGLKLNDKHITRPIPVLEDDIERTLFNIKNPYPTSPTSFAAINFLGGNGLGDSELMQVGQRSDGSSFIYVGANEPFEIYTNGELRAMVNANGTVDFARNITVPNATASNHAVNKLQLEDNVLMRAMNYTVNMATDFPRNSNLIIYCDSSGGDFTITLPSASAMKGYTIGVINSGLSGVVTVQDIGLDAGKRILFKSDGVNIYEW